MSLQWRLVSRIHGYRYPKDQPWSKPYACTVGGLLDGHVVPYLEERSRVVDNGSTLEIYVRFKRDYVPEEA